MLQDNAQNLQGTLMDIKARFGITPFLERNRIVAYLADLAPELKKERNMIDRLGRLGIMKDFAEAADKDESFQRRVYAKSLAILTDMEYIREDIASDYLAVVAATFEWNFKLNDKELTKNHSAQPPKKGVAKVGQNHRKQEDRWGSNDGTDSQLLELPSVSKDSNGITRFQKETSFRPYQTARHLFKSGYYTDAEKLLRSSELAENSMAYVILGRIYVRKNDRTSQQDAIKQFEKAKQLGNPLGTAWISELNHDSSRKEYEEVKKDVEQMAHSGLSEAQYFVGHAYLYGTVYQQNFNEALDWLQKASNQGDTLAKYDIVSIFYKGLGVPKDEGRAINLLKQCATSQDPEINLALGKAYLIENDESSSSTAFTHLLKAANADLHEAQDLLADLYHKGMGVKQSDENAALWLEKAADAGYASSQYKLGYCYKHGLGIKQNHDKAFKYLRLAADQGNSAAQYALYPYYLDPDYKEHDVVKGLSTLHAAAESGITEAYIRLAECYVGGYGVSYNPESHFYWAKKAAEAGYPKGQRFLGIAYLDNNIPDIIPSDDKMGVEWLSIAWRNGDKSAYIRLVKFYAEHKEKSPSGIEMENMFNQADQFLESMDKSNVPTGQEHLWLASAVDSWYGSNLNKSLALDHYCEAYIRGKGSHYVLARIADIHFLSGMNSNHLKTSDAMWVKEIREVCENSQCVELLFTFAQMLYLGEGVKKNWPEAIGFAKKASDLGNSKSDVFLAEHYLNSSGSESQAFDYAEKAYQSGAESAIRLLGICYDAGYGVSKDRTKGKKLLMEAAEKGDKKAEELLKNRSFFSRFRK